MDAFESIFENIKNDPQNTEYTRRGIDPLYAAAADSRIVIIGQAPGRVAQETRTPWNDKSGDRLREWMGIDRDAFYDPHRVAVIPMDFYYPGKGRSSDLPPRKDFAQKWHPQLLKLMPDVQLTVLVGAYAMRRYLKLKASDPITEVVRDWRSYLPRYFPLVHPSPRNQIWMKKNPWFEKEAVVALQDAIAHALGDSYPHTRP